MRQSIDINLVMCRLVGLFLIATASLKLTGLSVQLVAQSTLPSTPWLRLALIEYEFFLGIWLVAGIARRAAWFAALLTFGLFTSVGFWAGLSGQVTCGCFGNTRISPWLVFVFDIAVVFSLLRWQATDVLSTMIFTPFFARVPARSWWIGLGSLTCIGLLLAAGEPLARLSLRIERSALIIEPRETDAGTGSEGDRIEFKISLRNPTNREIRVIGGRLACGMPSDDIPITVPAHDTRGLKVKFLFRGSAGRFRDSLILFTDDKNHPLMIGYITGRVRDATR